MTQKYIDYLINEFAMLGIKKIARERIQFYEDDWRSSINAKLAELYPNSNINASKRAFIDINAVKFVVDETANGGFYSKGVTREAVVNEVKQDVYDEYLYDEEIDIIMDKAYRYALASNGVVIESMFIDGIIKRRLHYLDNVELAFHPISEELIGVRYYTNLWLPEDYEARSYSGGALSTFDRGYQYSLRDGIVYYSELKNTTQGAKVVNEEPRPEYNGVLPFVFLTFVSSSAHGVDMDIGQDLIDAQLAVAKRLTGLEITDDFNSWVQIVMKIPFGHETNNEEGKDITNGINGLAFSPDRVHVTQLSREGHGYGVSIQNETAIPQSGFSLLVSNRKINERRMSHEKILRMAERKLFDIEKQLINAFGKRKIDIRCELSLDYDSVETIYTSNEIVIKQAHDFEYGIDHPIRVLMRNKGLTEDDAIAEWQQNIEWKRSMMPSLDDMMTHSDNNDNNNEDEDEDENDATGSDTTLQDGNR